MINFCRWTSRSTNEPLIVNDYQISCTGCGIIEYKSSGQGLDRIIYEISNSDFEKLKHSNIYKIRVYLSDSYLEEEIKIKCSNNLITLFNLIKWDYHMLIVEVVKNTLRR